MGYSITAGIKYGRGKLLEESALGQELKAEKAGKSRPFLL